MSPSKELVLGAPHDRARSAPVADLRAAGLTDPQLAADYNFAYEVMTAHGTSYAQATRLLPAASRASVWALYGFARIADDFLDARETPDAEGFSRWVTAFWAAADMVLPAPQVREYSAHPYWPYMTSFEVDPAQLRATPTDGVGRAMLHTMGRYGLHADCVAAFLHSMAMDLTVTTYATYADLQRYMYGSAEVIGLQMLPLLGRPSPEAARYAALLGEAFQVTNFLRDVAEDSARGRCYIPLDILRAHDLTVADVAAARIAGRSPARLKMALAELGALNAATYAAARPGIELLAPESRPGIECAFLLYRGILDRLRRNGFETMTGRTYVPTWRRAALAGQAVGRTATQRARMNISRRLTRHPGRKPELVVPKALTDAAWEGKTVRVDLRETEAAR